MPKRPKYLNLLQIRLPLPGIISILHRVSGAVLFLALPLLLCGLQQSLASAESFSALQSAFSHWAAKLVALGLAWGYLHHLCAGLRHLALDLDIGTDLAATRLSSMVVLGVSLLSTAVVAVLLW